MELNLIPDTSCFTESVRTVESHAGGMAARVIIGGIPELNGATVRGKMEEFRNNYDHIRTALVGEPRGHDSIVAAVLTKPCIRDADFGLFFIQQPGYLDMCGHGTIATSTVLVDCGFVEVCEPVTRIVYDTPAGKVQAEVSVVNGKAAGVSFINVPSYVYKKDMSTVFRRQVINYDAVYGGDCYAMIDSSQLGMKIAPETVNELMKTQLELLPQIRKETAEMGIGPDDPFIEGIEFYDESPTPGCDSRNVVLNGRLIDRSPCGTGTCAKLALLYSRGEINVEEDYVNESFIGTTFIGRIIGVTEVNGKEMIIPRVSGRGFVTGTCTFLIDQDDPLKYGLIL